MKRNGCLRLVGVLILLACNCLAKKTPAPTTPAPRDSKTPAPAPSRKELDFHVTVAIDPKLDREATTTCSTAELNHFASKLTDHVLVCAQNILGYNDLTLDTTTWSSARRRRTTEKTTHDKQNEGKNDYQLSVTQQSNREQQQERGLQLIDPRIYFDGSYGCRLCLPDDRDERRRRGLGMLSRHYSLEAAQLEEEAKQEEEEKQSGHLLLRGGRTPSLETPSSSSSSSRSFSRHDADREEERRGLTTTRITFNLSDQVFEQDMSNDLTVAMQGEAAAWLLSNTFLRSSCLGDGTGVVVTFSII